MRKRKAGDWMAFVVERMNRQGSREESKGKRLEELVIGLGKETSIERGKATKDQ